MKNWILGMAVALLGLGLAATDVEAKRLGGGGSMGAQRNITNAPPATPPARQAQQAAPAQQASPAQAAAPAAASGFSRWMPMLGGLALGGLLGAMFGGSGFAGALMSVLMIALLAFAALFLVRMLMRPKQPAAQPMQYAGLGNETVAAPPPSQAAGFEQQANPVRNLPSGFDAAGFLRAAKLNFIKLQIANDLGNVGEMREFTTPEMFEELQRDVAQRGGEKQQTDVVTLNADLLEVVTEGGTHWASVRFSGMVSDAPGQAPVGFEEVWNLAKPADGSTGWLLAGIQQMH